MTRRLAVHYADLGDIVKQKVGDEPLSPAQGVELPQTVVPFVSEEDLENRLKDDFETITSADIFALAKVINGDQEKAKRIMEKAMEMYNFAPPRGSPSKTFVFAEHFLPMLYLKLIQSSEEALNYLHRNYNDIEMKDVSKKQKKLVKDAIRKRDFSYRGQVAARRRTLYIPRTAEVDEENPYQLASFLIRREYGSNDKNKFLAALGHMEFDNAFGIRMKDGSHYLILLQPEKKFDAKVEAVYKIPKGASWRQVSSRITRDVNLTEYEAVGGDERFKIFYHDSLKDPQGFSSGMGIGKISNRHPIM